MDKIISARRAFSRLQAILDDTEEDEKTRDAASQRFEFTSEICWKALQVVLKELG